jgi:hypothetical protein
MDTYGRATSVRPNSGSEAGAPGARSRQGLSCWLLVACVGILLLGGCAPSTLKFGTTPRFDRLSELTPGVSTSKDVRAVLGEPQGRGAARSQGFDLKDTWLYEGMEVEGATVHMRMLMIFLDHETGAYHGHMWMASGAVFGLTREE